MPSAQDSASVKEGGLACQVLGPAGAATVVEFPEMSHGWTVRGDIGNEDVRRDVKKAMGLAAVHFERYVK